MKPILGPEAGEVFKELARKRALLAFDFDGTLAPIVADRAKAQMRPDTRQLLRAAALLYPCAVISGRARADVAARLEGIPLLAVVGNHGAEAGRGPLDRSRRAKLETWKAALSEELRGVKGVDIEDKRFSLALHYRQAASRADARRKIMRVVRELQGARVFGGHAVVNVAPSESPDKAAALEELLQRTGRRRALYIGDDRTDEDVFRRPDVAVSIRVGRTARSEAAWFVPSQAAVDDLLRKLIEARARLDGMPTSSADLLKALAG
jgi:trehalose 6-phosphate phosphatase